MRPLKNVIRLLAQSDKKIFVIDNTGEEPEIDEEGRYKDEQIENYLSKIYPYRVNVYTRDEKKYVTSLLNRAKIDKFYETEKYQRGEGAESPTSAYTGMMTLKELKRLDELIEADKADPDSYVHMLDMYYDEASSAQEWFMREAPEVWEAL